MSLEQKIQELTEAVITLTDVIERIESGDRKLMSIDECIDSIPTINKPKKAPAPVVEPAPVVQAAPVMPAAPTFEPVEEAAPAGGAPFTDGKGLIDYVMTIYKELGPEKGAKIQGVLTEMGLQNVNELRPTEYDAFYSKVEALK